MKKLFRLFLGGVGLLTLCLIVTAIFGPSVDDEQVVTTSEPTPIVEQVEIVKPTLAILLPTEKPKAVPVEDDADEYEYLTFVEYAAEQWVEAMDELSALLFDAADDTRLFDDNDWRSEVAVTLAVFKTVDDAILYYSPVPVKYAFVHAFLINAALEYGLMVDKLSQGIDYRDVNLIEEAAEHIENGTYAILEANAALERLSD